MFFATWGPAPRTSERSGQFILGVYQARLAAEVTRTLPGPVGSYGGSLSKAVVPGGMLTHGCRRQS